MTAFERYIAAGAGRPDLWRLFAGIVLISSFWIGGTFAVLLVSAALAAGPGDPGEALRQLADLGPAGELAAGPGIVLVALLTFSGIWMGVLLTVRLLHGQPFHTIFAPDRRVRRGDFARGVLVAVAFTALSAPFALALAQPVQSGLAMPVWLAALLPVIALVFVQATAEELIFRGYLLQQLALRSRSPLLWAVLPSALFGALHYSGGLPGAAGLLYVGTTFLMGLALAALVWRTGSLWASIGVHVGFNVIALTLVGTEGVMSGAQLFLFRASDLPALMQVDMAMTALLLAFVLSPLAPFGPARDEAEGRGATPRGR